MNTTKLFTCNSRKRKLEKDEDFSFMGPHFEDNDKKIEVQAKVDGTLSPNYTMRDLVIRVESIIWIIKFLVRYKIIPDSQPICPFVCIICNHYYK